MLQKQTNISQSPSIHATQSIYPLTKQTLQSTPPPFPSIENDNEGKNKNDNVPKEDLSHNEHQEELLELADYTANIDIHELFNAFFVVKHKHLFILRSKIRHEQISGHQYLPALINIEQAQNLRERCYHLQFILIEIYKGKKFNRLF